MPGGGGRLKVRREAVFVIYVTDGMSALCHNSQNDSRVELSDLIPKGESHVHA